MNAAATAEEDLRRLNEAAFDEAGVDLTQIDMMLNDIAFIVVGMTAGVLQGAPAVRS